MSQQIGFSILTAPLAAIDRRTLSQAWYSALHLAADHPSEATPPRRKSASLNESARSASLPARTAAPIARPKTAIRATSAKGTKREATAAPERRGVRSPLARKIERTLLTPSAPSTRATFSIGAARERVHIALHVRGARVRLVAICAPRVRERVARALAQARYALAQRGVALEPQGDALRCS